MAEWFFRKKSKVEVERDPAGMSISPRTAPTEESLARSRGLSEIANQWKDDAE